MRGVGEVAIPNYMCSSMGCPHTELAPYACTSSTVDLPPFVEVVLFVVFDIGGWFELLSC